MQQNELAYSQGALDALNEIQSVIVESIVNNNGAKTMNDVLNVYNDLVHHLHNTINEVRDIIPMKIKVGALV